MNNTSLLHRKESLVLTTIDVINECGIQAVSTKEIARRQGVSEATIFKHFKTKSELMLAVLNHFSQYDLAIARSIEVGNMRPKDAIVYFFESFLTYYQNYPAITTIEHSFDVLQCEPELSVKMKEIFKFRFDLVDKLVKEAKKAGEIRGSIDSALFADILHGTFREVCLKWRIAKYTFPLKDRAISSIKMLLELSSDNDPLKVTS